MTTANIAYGTPVTMTMTLASLATDTNLLVGRQSTAVDNSSTKDIDHLVGGKIVTAASTANTQVQIWAFGSYDGTTYTASAGASDAGFTPTSSAKNLMKLLAVCPNVPASAITFAWGPYSVAQAFGGVLPQKWGIYIVHNTGANLNASGHEVKYTPVEYTSA